MFREQPCKMVIIISYFWYLNIYDVINVHKIIVKIAVQIIFPNRKPSVFSLQNAEYFIENMTELTSQGFSIVPSKVSKISIKNSMDDLAFSNLF